MTPGRVDLGGAGFWLFALAAVLLLAPWSRGQVRRLLLAGLDLTFVTWLAGPAGAALALGLCALVGGVAHFLYRRPAEGSRATAPLLAACGAALLSAFTLHKLGPPVPALTPLRAGLGAIGFSYAALRAVELLRAAAERRGEPPAPLQVVHYLLPFHMLSAGPILAWEEYRAAPEIPPPLTLDQVLDALSRVAHGLVKKFVLAYLVERGLLTGFSGGGPYLVLEVQAYYLWVYLDFSAYSDVAVGLGRLLGTPTPENFRAPLLARNLVDFWERWHVSLSTFIRRNAFIPLQLWLERRSDGARPLRSAALALLVSFVGCGLWHGLSLRFLAWGAIHALAMIATNLYRSRLRARLGAAGLKRYLARPLVRVVATALTFELVAWSLWFVAPRGGG